MSGDVEYEDGKVPEIVLTRRRNIARNAAVLAALGIDNLKPPPPSPRQSTSSVDRSDRTRVKKRGLQEFTPPTRRSSRIKGEQIDDHQSLPNKWREPEGTSRRRPPPEAVGGGEALAALEARQEEYAADSYPGAKLKGTASYAHCLERVLTMTDSALARRVQVIERARGAKAKEKMLVFTHVLLAQGKQDLLELAEAALHRLVRGLPPPPKGSPRQSPGGGKDGRGKRAKGGKIASGGDGDGDGDSDSPRGLAGIAGNEGNGTGGKKEMVGGDIGEGAAAKM